MEKTDRPSGASPSPSEEGEVRAWLYDVDGSDSPVAFDASHLPDLGDRQILWVDVDLQATGSLSGLWDDLGLRDHVAGLDNNGQRPQVVAHDDFLHLTVYALNDDPEDFRPMILHCVVGRNWIITLHHGDLDLVDRFNEPLVGETRLGQLSAPAFLATVLDWQLNSFFHVIEELHTGIDRLDEELLKHELHGPGLLDRLVAMRRRVRQLRTTLSPHREVFALLGHPESEPMLGTDATPHYRQLADRLERALDAVDTAREMIVGSFDIFMTRTAQNTNDVMKRLTLASVLLLPAGVIAGIMGMNFKIGFFESPGMFWVVLAIMVLIAGLTLVVARRSKWI